MRQWIWMVLVVALAAVLGYWYAGYRLGGLEDVRGVRTDTMVVTRDVRCPSAVESVYVDRVSVRYALREVRDTDSVVVYVDTALHEVSVPITQRVYEDSMYTAWVSGYMARMDSIRVRSVVVTRRVSEWKRWCVGIQGGMGVTPKGVLPYVGVGVTYRLNKP